MIFEINEIFTSLSGEAPETGRPMLFVRMSGCNLSCSYCDTKYHNEINLRLTSEKLKTFIIEKTSAYPGLGVLFTGGEPLWNNRADELSNLMRNLPDIDFFMETNGSVFIGEPAGNCRYVLDIKTPSSGHGDSFCDDNLRILRAQDCIKFVAGADDLDFVREKYHSIKNRNRQVKLYLSPQKESLPLKSAAEFIIENRLDMSLSVQLHKIIWDPATRGV